MSVEQQVLLDKADQALRTAALALDAGDAEGATNRAYYACFYLARAAVIGQGEAPKTHSGVHRRFALHYVAPGAVPVEVGRILPYAFAARLRADYDAAAVTDTAAAADLLRDAERFVAAVRPLL